ncbi:MAG: hypothetical protein LBJ40_18025 [Delftia acidovorans]|nr:hypothetical protein [Delftia acidovorans]
MSDSDESSFFVDVIKIALGVFIGGLVAALAYEQILAWRVNEALKEVQAQTQRATAQIQRSQELAEQQRQRDREEQDEQRRQALEQARQEGLRQERKNAAWERFYQPPEVCKVDSATMPCVNAYMAAKKRFELQYRD